MYHKGQTNSSERHQKHPLCVGSMSKETKSSTTSDADFVRKELQAKTKEAYDLHNELFSAMPPWETVKSLLSFPVTDGVSDPEEQLEIGIFDISRAHFVPRADRELYIELPDEAQGTRGWRCDCTGERSCVSA